MKKFENIVIASDLDGTYFADGTKLVQRNLERVKYFCDNGGHFTFATGRLPIFTRKAMPNAHELVNLPAVTGNGTCLYDYQNKRPLEEQFINTDMFCDLANLAKELAPDVGFRGVTPDGFVLPSLENRHNLREYNYFPDFMEKHLLPMDSWNELDVYKVNILGEKDDLVRLYPILCDRFSDIFTVSRAGFFAIEVMPFGTSKAKMLKKMVNERFGESVMLCTVGDHDNDLEMHSVADLPVCPSNANDAVKNICKHIFCDNNSGVIGDLIDFLDRQI